MLQLKDVSYAEKENEKEYILQEQFTHEQFAKMIASTRESVTRTLSQFVQQGYIRIDEKVITLLRIDELKAIAKKGISPAYATID